MLNNIALVQHYVIVGGCDFAIIYTFPAFWVNTDSSNMNVVDLHEKVARLNIWLFGLCSRVRIGEEARKRQVMPGSQFTNRFWEFQLFFDRFDRWWLDSSPDWFGSNQDLDDQTDVIRARLSNTKYDTIFSVSKDYNLTLVEWIYNIVIPNLALGQKPSNSVKHFWKAPRPFPVLDYQMVWREGQIWYSREIDLHTPPEGGAPPCRGAPPASGTWAPRQPCRF